MFLPDSANCLYLYDDFEHLISFYINDEFVYVEEVGWSGTSYTTILLVEELFDFMVSRRMYLPRTKGSDENSDNFKLYVLNDRHKPIVLHLVVIPIPQSRIQFFAYDTRSFNHYLIRSTYLDIKESLSSFCNPIRKLFKELE